MPIGLLVFLMLKSLDILGIHYFKKALMFGTFVAFRVLKYFHRNGPLGSCPREGQLRVQNKGQLCKLL